MSGVVHIVDDQDEQSIEYLTPSLWVETSLQQAQGGTIHGGLAGAQARFNFSGTAVAVVGWADYVPSVGPPAIRFSIDGVAVQTTTAPNNGTKLFQYEFFEEDSLQASSHSLVMDVLNATEEYYFALDFIAYLPTSNSNAPGSITTVTNTLIPFATATPASGSTSGSSSGPPVGAIVGGVVGGLAVLVAAIIAVWFLFFRHRRGPKQAYIYATSAEAGDLLNDQETKPSPYIPPAPSTVAPSTVGSLPYNGVQPQAQSTYSTTSYSQPPSGLQQPIYERATSDYSAGGSSAGPSASGSSQLGLAAGSRALRTTSSPNQNMSKAAEAGLLSVPQQTTFYADSGVRFDQNGQPIPAAGSSSSSSAAAVPHEANELSEVPPSYSAT